MSDFTSNFGSASPAYSYSDGSDTLLIDFTGLGFFIEAQFIDASFHLIEPSVPLILEEVFLIPSLNVKIAVDTFSGGFTPTPVPEPSAWVMLLLGFAGFGLGASRKRDPRPGTALEGS